MVSRRGVVALGLAAALGGAGWAGSGKEIRIPVTEFRAADLERAAESGEGWLALGFPKRAETKYAFMEKDGQAAIEAVSKASASGLIYPIEIDPMEYPIIEWSWKVEGPVPGGNLRKKSGDDYAARVYLTFDYDASRLSWLDRVKHAVAKGFAGLEVPRRAINYIWANQAEEGTIAPNPYTDWVCMIAVDTGEKGSGQWRSYSRDLVADYEAAFGEEPGKVTGVAIMTDTDDTKSQARAYYLDIVFRKRGN